MKSKMRSASACLALLATVALAPVAAFAGDPAESNQITNPAFLPALDAFEATCAQIADEGPHDDALLHRDRPRALAQWKRIDDLLIERGGFEETSERSGVAAERLRTAMGPRAAAKAANDLCGAVAGFYDASTAKAPDGFFRIAFLLRSIRLSARAGDWSGAASTAQELSAQWNDVTTEARDRGIPVSTLTPLDAATAAFAPIVSRRDLRAIERVVPADLASLPPVRSAFETARGSSTPR